MESSPTPPPLPTTPVAAPAPPPLPAAFAADPALDADLERRVRRGNRVMLALAILVSLASAALAIGNVLGGQSPSFYLPRVAAFVALAAGYWMLALAARRRNPLAPTLLLVLMVLHLAATVVMSGVNAAREHRSFALPVVPIAIQLAIGAFVAGGRSALLEARRREVRAAVSPAPARGRALCIAGAACLLGAHLAIDLGSFGSYPAPPLPAREARLSRDLARLLTEDEARFQEAAVAAFDHPGEPSIREATRRLDELARAVETIQAESAGTPRVRKLATGYADAIRRWRGGLERLQAPGSDATAARKVFAMGDEIREGVRTDYNRYYTDDSR